jgi:uncharacterized protein (DUF2235 family)
MTLRNLILLFDGTWNKAKSDGDDDQTNVEKFYRLLADSYRENIYYEEGVGVKSEEQVTGGIFGAGIDERILGAYRFLQSRYMDSDFDNRLFIFGFSRGAYTARTFSQLLYYCGLPTKQENCRKAWRCYYNQEDNTAIKASQNYIDVEIEMLGVWDTVKSTLDKDRKDTTLYPNVKAAYHAMAIDERRRNFPVLRFHEDERVKQVWFAGVHSDIGGGYSSEESQLSDIALSWMIDGASQHGVEFREDFKDYLDPNPTSKMHDSYVGEWKYLGENMRHIEDQDSIHLSVQARLNGDVGYAPSNLPLSPKYVP